MRLWSLHPKYLDAPGLVALWREGLLARAVLRGRTNGYRLHPQLARFRAQSAPLSAISAYLDGVHAESLRRGYDFDACRMGRVPRLQTPIPVNLGQLEFEWQHLLQKLAARNPELHRRLRSDASAPLPHPLFLPCDGPIETWERPKA